MQRMLLLLFFTSELFSELLNLLWLIPMSQSEFVVGEATLINYYKIKFEKASPFSIADQFQFNLNSVNF